MREPISDAERLEEIVKPRAIVLGAGEFDGKGDVLPSAAG
jgi:hypothetical protein